MSYAIVRRLFPGSKGNRRPVGGLTPPAATPGMILRDLRWHGRIYQEDGLPRRDRVTFLFLRVLQRVAYSVGWWAGRPR